MAFLQTMHALTGSPLQPGNKVEILKNGVQIFPSMLAAVRSARQTINMESQDGICSTVGSSNFDDRSFRLNDEVNVNIYDEGVARQMEEMFAEDLARSVEITMHKWAKRSILAKIKETAARFLKPQL